jgi:hypothetical protein
LGSFLWADWWLYTFECRKKIKNQKPNKMIPLDHWNVQPSANGAVFLGSEYRSTSFFQLCHGKRRGIPQLGTLRCWGDPSLAECFISGDEGKRSVPLLIFILSKKDSRKFHLLIAHTGLKIHLPSGNPQFAEVRAHPGSGGQNESIVLSLTIFQQRQMKHSASDDLPKTI